MPIAARDGWERKAGLVENPRAWSETWGCPTHQSQDPGGEPAAEARGKGHFLKCVTADRGPEAVIHRNVICTRSVAALFRKCWKTFVGSRESDIDQAARYRFSFWPSISFFGFLFFPADEARVDAGEASFPAPGVLRVSPRIGRGMTAIALSRGRQR